MRLMPAMNTLKNIADDVICQIPCTEVRQVVEIITDVNYNNMSYLATQYDKFLAAFSKTDT